MLLHQQHVPLHVPQEVVKRSLSASTFSLFNSRKAKHVSIVLRDSCLDLTHCFSYSLDYPLCPIMNRGSVGFMLSS